MAPLVRVLLAIPLLALILSLPAASGGDGGQARYRVQGVAQNDPLNLRAGPGTGTRVLGEIPYDARGLTATGRARRVGSQRWREVTFEGRTGWVNERFIVADTDSPAAEERAGDVATPAGPQPKQPAASDQETTAQGPSEVPPPAAPPPTLPPGEIACHPETRAVAVGDETRQVPGYTCRSDTGPLFRIETVALSEFATSKLLFHRREDGTSIKIDEVVGSPRLIPTKVSERTKELFETYGASFKVSDLWHLTDEQEIAAIGGLDGKVRLLRAPFNVTYSGPDAGGIDIPNLEEHRQIRKSQSWPERLKHSYYVRSGICRSALTPNTEQTEEQRTGLITSVAANCVIAWRHAVPQDLNNVPRDVDLMRELELDVGLGDSPRLSKDFADGNHAKFLDLMSMLTKDGWPEDWLVVFAMPNGCGQAAFRSALLARELNLTALTVENLSDRDIDIGMLVGGSTDVTSLRPASGEPSDGKAPVGPLIGRLGAGMKVILPTGLSFRQDNELEADPIDLRKIDELIKSLPPDAVIEENEGMGPKLVSSYKPPEVPKGIEYAWGPAIHASGIEIGGKTVTFKPAEPERIDLTVDGGSAASCPYLASWDESNGDWVLHGKVIQSADGPARETRETIPLGKFSSRLRLQELEMEVAHINHAAMKIETANGRVHWLAPRQPALLFWDRRYVSIHAGESVELEFELPAGVVAEQVHRTSLTVSGYYRRYADMLVAVSDEEARACRPARMALAATEIETSAPDEIDKGLAAIGPGLKAGKSKNENAR